MLWRLGRHGPLQKSRHSKKHVQSGDLVSNVYTFPLHKMHWYHSQTDRWVKAESLGLRVFVADAQRHFQQRKTAGNGGSDSRLAVKALQTRKTADNVGDGQEDPAKATNDLRKHSSNEVVLFSRQQERETSCFVSQTTHSVRVSG